MRTHRSRVPLVTTLVVVAGLSSACGDAPTKSGADLPPVTLTALSYNNPGRPGGDQLVEFARLVAASDSGVTLKILTAPNAGTQDTSVMVVDQVRTGEADLGVVSSRSFDTLGVNAFKVIQAPLLANSNAAADAILDSRAVDGMLESLAPLELTGIGLAFDVFGYPVGFGAPLLGPETWAGKTISARPSAITKDTVRALGAEADPVNGSDAEEAVDQGRVTGTFDSLVGPTSPVVGGILTANVPMYFRANVFVLNTKVWKGLAPRQQAALRDAADGAKKWAKEQHVDDVAAAATYCEQKGDVVLASAEELAALHKATAPVYDAMGSDPSTSAALAAAVESVKGIPAEPAPAPCRQSGQDTDTDSPDSLDVVDPKGDQHRLDGVWRWTVRYAEMVRRGASKEDASNNKGTWTLTIEGGSFSYVEPVGRKCFGSATLDDSRVTLVGAGRAPCDAYIDALWQRNGDRLVLRPGSHYDAYFETFFKAFWAEPLVRIGDPP